MKAFKGCTNPECNAYKKIRYKNTDEFCSKCGKPTSFVCAACWKPMEDGSVKYCISCAAEKEQNHAENWEALKKCSKTMVAVASTLGTVIVAVPKFVKNADKLTVDAKKAANAVAEVIELVKK